MSSQHQYDRIPQCKKRQTINSEKYAMLSLITGFLEVNVKLPLFDRVRRTVNVYRDTGYYSLVMVEIDIQ